MKISIQGYRGSFHHEVACDIFGKRCEILERDSFWEVFEDVETLRADRGIIAVANSSFGGMCQNYDLFLEYEVFVNKEFFLPIRQNLIGQPGVKLENIKKILSHPIALHQCGKFLRAHPEWKQIHNPDTAGSVKHISKIKNRSVAAIAGNFAADEYGMEILKKNIHDDPYNCTRFFVIAREKKFSSSASRTSIAFMATHQSGSLEQILRIFSENGINLSQLQARPIVRKGIWQYYFYMDFDAGISENKTQKIFHQLEQQKLWTLKKVLGSYQAGDISFSLKK
jgi:prephenate dehydratase